jgi:thiol-disulfide isomerase/thioredoxin
MTPDAPTDTPEDTPAPDVPGPDVPNPDVPGPDIMPPDVPALDAVPDSGDSLPSPDTVADVGTSHWPTNPDKDQIPDPGWESTPDTGTVMPNFTAIDQYGDEVQLYDLAMEGKPIILDVGTWFCEPCKSLAWYLATGETGPCPYADTILEDLGWWNEDYELILDLVNSGTIRWVTVLYSLGNPVTPQDAEAWHETFPNDEILVFADSTLQLQEYLDVGPMPRIDVLDENMNFLIFYPNGPTKGLKKLVELYGE